MQGQLNGLRLAVRRPGAARGVGVGVGGGRVRRQRPQRAVLQRVLLHLRRPRRAAGRHHKAAHRSFIRTHVRSGDASMLPPGARRGTGDPDGSGNVRLAISANESVSRNRSADVPIWPRNCDPRPARRRARRADGRPRRVRGDAMEWEQPAEKLHVPSWDTVYFLKSAASNLPSTRTLIRAGESRAHRLHFLTSGMKTQPASRRHAVRPGVTPCRQVEKLMLPATQLMQPATQLMRRATQRTRPAAQRTRPAAQRRRPATQRTRPATQQTRSGTQRPRDAAGHTTDAACHAAHAASPAAGAAHRSRGHRLS
eukprot:gene9214-biopygen339